jgi:hypothetical protein
MPDAAYTMEQQGVADQALSGGGSDPRMAATQMDPATMAQLFGSDDDESQEAAPDDEQAEGDQAPDQVDPGKLQSVLSDPGLLMAVAQVLKTLGTGDDTDLVHVTDQEKAMLKQGGGEGTRNPTTGLLQYVKRTDAGVPDWYGMDPDARLAAIGGRTAVPPTWSDNWWMAPREATQGGMTRNMTGEDFANANVAVTPSWGTAMNMAGLVTGMTGGPLAGIVGALTKNAVGSLFGGSFGDAFNTPGGRLAPADLDAVAAAYNDAVNRGLPTAQVMNAATNALAAARGAYGGGPGGQPGGVAPGAAGGIGVDKAGNAYGTNIGGAGMSHNLAAAGTMAGAMAMADRARAFAAGGYGRATPAGAGGNGGGGGGLGGAGGGGDGSGGMGGGAGNKGGGSNRSD